MTRTRILVTGSTLALGAALTFATPAAAQVVCDTNVGLSGTATNADDLACGPASTATGGGLVGSDGRWRLPNDCDR